MFSKHVLIARVRLANSSIKGIDYVARSDRSLACLLPPSTFRVIPIFEKKVFLKHARMFACFEYFRTSHFSLVNKGIISRIVGDQ